MSTPMPDNQAVARKTTTQFNQKFAEVAESCRPKLHEWIERPLEVMSFKPDTSAWFQCHPAHRMTIDELASTPVGKGDDFILDFGGHRVGYFSFHLGAVGNNIDAPCRLRLTFGEVPPDVTENLADCKSWISTSWLPDEVINVDWLPTNVDMPRRYSFRYVRIQVIDTSQQYRALFSDVRVRAVSSVSPETFNSVPALNDSRPLLHKIDAVSQRTLRNCMHTVFEDGPRRDRRLWSGDLRLQALTNYATFKDFALVKRCLYMFAAVAGADGSLPACLYEFPTLHAASDYIVDYDALFGAMVYDYAVASSDLDTARDLWPTVVGSLTTALSHLSPTTGAFDSARSDLWKFLDWDLTLHADAGMHGVVLYCCKRVDALAELLGYPPRYEAAIASMTAAATTAFYDSAAGVFVSGPAHQISWLSQAWLALAGALPPDQSMAALLRTMKDPAALKPLCPYGWATFAEALAVCGAKEECLKLLETYWGGMVERGADTFWECFDPKDYRKSPYQDYRNNSYCHAWSCSPAWLLRSVLFPDS
ncbi:bacterial alpha-L-rhamnosidase domain-containing protein [Tricharina praecox]|uniref:bacterial alpha-L-rhamnosidase domain-containing protein n=1 Tax=Tricharina praecox TaxID=43433 RepID=UPI002220AC0C|nr:bacterial alpha-L-rhamnosidase domain-containing protein [Tricharina praecox]KAI5841713.1 bacterial alpha-L-rhamnosidase domain-containing protein [Tricharina praecox]